MRIVASLFALACLLPSGAVAANRQSSSGRTLFIASAVEHPDGSVTLPLFRGTSRRRTVYHLILETTDGNLSQALGVNRSDKLNNARGTGAVQKVAFVNGLIDFPASVDFSPARRLAAPGGFPPTEFQPGAIGEDGYSPLIELPDGTIVNAPQIAMDADGDGSITLLTEAADKVVSIDPTNLTVTYAETAGFQGGKAVRYVSTDASDPLAATLEGVTFAPALNTAPGPGDDSTHSSRASLAAFVNGQTGPANPQRQGLNSAVAGDGDPLNVLRWNPSQGRYSPLWDVHLAAWTPPILASGLNLRQDDWNDIQGLVAHGQVTAPGGGAFGPAGFIVNCPIVSSE